MDVASYCDMKRCSTASNRHIDVMLSSELVVLISLELMVDTDPDLDRSHGDGNLWNDVHWQDNVKS